MTNLKFLQKLLILLFIGISICTLQACDEDEDEKMEEPDTEKTDDKIENPNIENEDDIIQSDEEHENVEEKTLFKKWYLTCYSRYSDINWQSDEVVSWGEYMHFMEDGTLYWNNREGGEYSTYSLGIMDNNVMGSSFSAIRTTDNSDYRTFVVVDMTERYLLLYDSGDALYRGFVFCKSTSNGESGDSSNNNEEDIKTEECGHCHGSGECSGSNCNNGRCTRCDGTGYKYYPGVGGSTIKVSCGWCYYGKCESCRGRAVCPTCNGKGYWVIN